MTVKAGQEVMSAEQEKVSGGRTRQGFFIQGRRACRFVIFS
jgi:hypothetical protein